MRVRTSTGVRATDFYGHFFMSNTTDVELAAVDADKAIGVEIKHDDKLTSEDGVYIQVALLYTHRSGQRRLRVLNLALAVAHQLADVYRSAELDVLVNFLTKQAVWASRETPPRAIRDGLTGRCARSLAAYRRHCASPSSVGQLVLPDTARSRPTWVCPLCTRTPACCRSTRCRTSSPRRCERDWVRDVFGVDGPHALDTSVTELPARDNDTSEAVRDDRGVDGSASYVDFLCHVHKEIRDLL
ncbi:unnamed protein product [Leptidea sinapis]|uniref:Uncharacterized protein n=1 Tax=Leptidea sinapis TaxID=189913 RepID=A0A5E4PQF4_9NEOP|nr:unnamed protein product [Leptidea sinapis]